VAEFDIANVVGMITYNQELDLSALAETFEEKNEVISVNYEPAKNHWLQTRFAPDNTYVSFYRGGKCSITGAKSLDHFEQVVQRINKLMRELLDFDYEPAVEIKNIVATAEITHIPALEQVAIELGLEETEYEPEQFPALIYRGGEAVMLIFSSGKIVCTGLYQVDQISIAIDQLIDEIETVCGYD
jgi:transcription initiation factor TFIID TATA-box-binding protein